MTGEEFSRHIMDMTQTLYNICYLQLPQRSDYEDAVQESLLKAWKNLGRLRDERYLKTWIIRILINECHNIQKKYKLEIPAESVPASTPSQDFDPGLHDALSRLDEKLRLPVVLYYAENYPVKDIAKILRIPQGTVNTRMYRARQKLKEMLSEEVPESEKRV